MANQTGKHFKPKGAPHETAPQVPFRTGATAPGPYSRQNSAHSSRRAPQGAQRRPVQGSPIIPAAGPRRMAPVDGPSKPRRNALSIVLVAIGVILLLVAGGLFVKAQLGYKQAAEFYDTLTTKAISDSDGEGIPNVDFDALKKINDDVVGWLYIPGTNISYVVAQGETNDTYLRTLIDGTYNDNGSVFLDMDGAAPGVVDEQTTLYGHHMNDGSMFAQIYKTLDQEAFDKIEKVYYITPDATYEFEPLFTMHVEDDYMAARQTNFDGDAGLAQYLSDSLKFAEAQSKDAEMDLRETEKVLTLVTCDDAFLAQTKRAAMVCRLVGTVSAE